MGFEQWETTKLGDVCDVRRGSSPRPIKDYISDEGMPWVKIADATASDSRFITKTNQCIKMEGVSKSVIVSPGTLIISNSGTAGIPKFMKITACVHDGWLVITNLRGIDPNYLYYTILVSRRALLHNAYDSVMKNLTIDMIKDLEIYLPSLDEQVGISKTLVALDEKIELNNQIISNLEQLAQTLFKRWFVDFEFPNENGEPYKSSGGEMVESELGKIPKGWEIKSLGKLCDANINTFSSKENWDYISYLDTGSITKNSISGIQRLTFGEDKIPSRAKRKIRANDIVYSTVRPNQLHYVIIKEPVENMLVSTGFVVLTSKGEVSNDLIYQWITQDEVTQSLQTIAENSTSAYPSIKPRDILDIQVVVPTDEIKKKLGSMIEVFNRKISKKHQENDRLKDLRDTLLPKLLSGELKLPDESEVMDDVSVS